MINIYHLGQEFVEPSKLYKHHGLLFSLEYKQYLVHCNGSEYSRGVFSLILKLTQNKKKE